MNRIIFEQILILLHFSSITQKEAAEISKEWILPSLQSNRAKSPRAEGKGSWSLVKTMWKFSREMPRWDDLRYYKKRPQYNFVLPQYIYSKSCLKYNVWNLLTFLDFWYDKLTAKAIRIFFMEYFALCITFCSGKVLVAT